MADRWTALDDELDLWAANDMQATVWVRDDDAVSDSANLRKVSDLCRRYDAPLALAVIPANADAGLAAAVRECADAVVLQHGWAHRNHAGEGEKKTELGDHRPPEIVEAELYDGRRKLEALFGARFAPVLVPPWNRIGPVVASRLDQRGYAGLSTFGPRHRAPPPAPVMRVNTHVDIIDWRGTRGFRGMEAVVAQTVAHLAARRTGEADADEATGLITHHLVHDACCWDGIEAWLARLSRHAAVRWPTVDEMFGLTR